MFQAPSRFILIYTFCGAILAAFGFEFWQKIQIPAKKTGIFIFIFIAIIIGVFISQTYLAILPEPIVVSLYFGSGLALFFGGLSIIKNFLLLPQKNVLNGLIIFLVFIDLFTFSNQNEMFKSIDYYDSIHTNNKNWTSDVVYLEKRTEEFIKFNQNFRFDRFQEFKESSSMDLMFLPDTNLFNPQYHMINNFDPFVPGNYSEFITNLSSLPIPEQKKVLRVLGATSFISLDSPLVDKPDITTMKSENIVQWYNCGLVRPADEILKDLIYNGTIADKTRCLFLSGNESIKENIQKNYSLSGAIIHYSHKSAHSYEISYTSESDGWLVIRNNFYPGWKAILDEEDLLELYEADYLFTGIQVPSGNHKITLFYQPLSFRLGLLISFVSILILIVIRKTF